VRILVIILVKWNLLKLPTLDFWAKCNNMLKALTAMLIKQMLRIITKMFLSVLCSVSFVKRLLWTIPFYKVTCKGVIRKNLGLVCTLMLSKKWR